MDVYNQMKVEEVIVKKKGDEEIVLDIGVFKKMEKVVNNEEMFVWVKVLFDQVLVFNSKINVNLESEKSNMCVVVKVKFGMIDIVVNVLDGEFLKELFV